MYPRTMKSLNKKEVWYLLALTGNKIQHQSSRAGKDLRRLAMLCNTFDRNVAEYREMESKVEVDETPEQTSPVSGCYERYTTGDGPHDSELCDHEDDSDDSDSDEWNDSDDSDSDESDEWESAEVIDGVLPLADERRLQWFATYGEDTSLCTQNRCDECNQIDQKALALSDFNECHVEVTSRDMSKELVDRNSIEATKQRPAKTSTFVEGMAAAGTLVLPKTKGLVEQYQNLII